MQSESIKNLAAALAAAQAEMPSVPMNSVNPFLKNKFADLGAVINTSRPILAKHGLSVSQFPVSDGERVGVTTTLMHSSGEWMSQSVSLPLSDEKGKSAAQVAGSIVTYLRRYSWSSVLGLYADEDTDGNHPQTKKDNPKDSAEKPPKPEVAPEIEDARKRHGQVWMQASKKNLITKDAVKVWSITPTTTLDEIEAKIELIMTAIAEAK